MATLRIDITAPNAAFLNYAKDLGYSDTIYTLVDDVPVGSPNPQTAAQFLTEKIKGIVSVALAAKTAETIQRTKTEEARSEIVTNRTAIENAMTVSII